MKLSLVLIALICASCADYPLTGSFFVVDPSSGSKGGLTFRDGGTEVYGKFTNPDGTSGGSGSIFIPGKQVKTVPIIPTK